MLAAGAAQVQMMTEMTEIIVPLPDDVAGMSMDTVAGSSSRQNSAEAEAGAKVADQVAAEAGVAAKAEVEIKAAAEAAAEAAAGTEAAVEAQVHVDSCNAVIATIATIVATEGAVPTRVEA
jgi:hypothetical protein